MDKTGARRLICVSAAGAYIAGDPTTGWLLKAIVPRVFAKQFADVREMENVIRDSGLDWTLVRPTRLVSRPGTGRYRVSPGFPPPLESFSQNRSISGRTGWSVSINWRTWSLKLPAFP